MRAVGRPSRRWPASRLWSWAAAAAPAWARPTPRRPPASRPARPARPGAGDPPDGRRPRPSGQRPPRGLGLPRRRRPGCRRPALRARSRLDAADRHPGRAGDLVLRSTATADKFQLDFGEPLEITELTLDGGRSPTSHAGKDLVVAASVRKDQRYELSVDYSGTPEPIEAPTTRSDLSTTGFTIDPDHETWTMQEPYGAFTWYAVNDQPSDKALYDFASRALAVGRHRQRRADDQEDADGLTTTTFHRRRAGGVVPGDPRHRRLRPTSDTTPTGTRITYWMPAGPGCPTGSARRPRGLDFLEPQLGPVPVRHRRRPGRRLRRAAWRRRR